MLLVKLSQFFAAACQPKGSFFGLPTWYKYLPGVSSTDNVTSLSVCNPQINSINDIWLIVAAIIDMLLRIAVLAAIAFVVWGGFQYITSQGQSENTKKAKDTIISAIVGMIIALGAITFISFFARKIGQ